MQDIQETLVSFNFDNGDTISATLKYYKVYSWSPWNFLVGSLKDNCDILTYSLGIHYNSYGAMIGSHYGKNTFTGDFQAAVTQLVDFDNSGTDKIAI